MKLRISTDISRSNAFFVLLDKRYWPLISPWYFRSILKMYELISFSFFEKRRKSKAVFKRYHIAV